MVAIPAPLKEVYKKKPIPTLKLLLDIVRGGRPEDALTAMAYAVSLEEDPAIATVFVDYPKALLDAEPQRNEPSGRERMIKDLEQRVAREEKRNEEGKAWRQKPKQSR
jgi:hypothetical protein